MRLSKAVNISDLRRLARQRLPKLMFDYIDGGADDEVTLHANCRRFQDYQLLWDALVDVSSIDTSTEILGCRSSTPMVIAPTAASRLFHPRLGEQAVARAASQAGAIYTLSTLGTTTIEDIAALHPGPKWFQVYVWKDRTLVGGLLDRVRRAKFDAVVLTVDLPVAGNRERDPRNDFSIPPQLTPTNMTQVLAKPRYLLDFATSPQIAPANVARNAQHGSFVSYLNTQFDSSVTWEYVRWLKKSWGGPLAVKGICQPQDALHALDAGADAVWVSNHGGRQLDTAPAAIDCLSGVVSAVAGKADVIFDSGVRRGTDIVKALALGAKGVGLGRAYLYGLAAGGEDGVAAALRILQSELERCLALMGCPSLAALGKRFVIPPGAYADKMADKTEGAGL